MGSYNPRRQKAVMGGTRGGEWRDWHLSKRLILKQEPNLWTSARRSLFRSLRYTMTVALLENTASVSWPILDTIKATAQRHRAKPRRGLAGPGNSRMDRVGAYTGDLAEDSLGRWVNWLQAAKASTRRWYRLVDVSVAERECEEIAKPHGLESLSSLFLSSSVYNPLQPVYPLPSRLQMRTVSGILRPLADVPERIGPKLGFPVFRQWTSWLELSFTTCTSSTLLERLP
ncbi:hypothetical protein LZ31DRAFT_79808 [Colletotrichum somersetense]|nr:hypothetical protein LZ31DRAFT_79808 [Colletotrichum somersetense]